MKRKQLDLDKISYESLLSTRICDLGLTLKGSWIQVLVDELGRELARKGLQFKPHVWISTAWFSPYGIPGFAIPFYLFHPRLAQLEKEWFGEAEGNCEEWCMQLLRHEAGHALDNAFLLRKRKARQKIFGLSGTPYPKDYAPKPYSKNFVRHLENHYAQAHPDEDWAETFAVWLDPSSKWEKKYADFGALKKLELVDQMLSEIQGKPPIVQNREFVEDVNDCTLTVEAYLKNKKRKQRRAFVPLGTIPNLSRLKRQALGRKLAVATKERHYIINQALKELSASRKIGPQPSMKSLVASVRAFVRQKRHRIVM